jgi:hypothetical protein
MHSLFDLAFDHREECPDCRPALCPKGRELFQAAHDKCVQLAAVGDEVPEAKA